jgi:hypothetical protein
VEMLFGTPQDLGISISKEKYDSSFLIEKKYSKNGSIDLKKFML